MIRNQNTSNTPREKHLNANKEIRVHVCFNCNEPFVRLFFFFFFFFLGGGGGGGVGGGGGGRSRGGIRDYIRCCYMLG